MPFSLTPVAALDLNNKEIRSLKLINSNEALVGTIQGGFWHVTDIANNVATQAAGTGNDFVYAVDLDGQYAFTFSFDGGTTIRSRHLSDFDTSIDSKTIAPNEDVYGIAAKNGYVYAVSSNKLRIYSHVNGVMTLQNTVTIATDGFSKLFKMIGNFLYFSNNSEFRIYSIAADPTVPVLKAEMSDLASRPDLQVKGNYLYMVHYDGNMVTIRDITTILNDSGSFPLSGAGFPVVNEFGTAGNTQKMVINGNTLFTAKPNGSSAYEVGSFDVTNHLSVADLGVVAIPFFRDHPTGGPQVTAMDTISDRLFIGMNDYTFGARRLRSYTFELTPTPPYVVTPPQSQSVNNGASLTLSVVAAGTVPLSYQWKKNGVNISGATSSSYNIPVVSASDAASYTVFISNTAGNITSDPAVITVLTTPVINSLLESTSVETGDSITFYVDASGGIPLSYQWKKNGVNIIGATANSYNIPSVIPTDAGDYTVVVANSFGSVVSDIIVLEVAPVPGNLLTLSNTFPNGGNNFSTVVVGNKAFMIGDVTGLTMLDVTDPSNPIVLDNKYYSPGNPAWMIVTDGNYLYITWGSAIITVDITGIGNTLPLAPISSHSGSYKWLAIDGTDLYAGRETGNPRLVEKFSPVSGVLGSPVWTQSIGSDVMGSGAVHGNFVTAITGGNVFVMDKMTGAVTGQVSGTFGFGIPIPDIEIYQNALYVIQEPSLGGFGIRVYPLTGGGSVGSLLSSGTYGSGMSNAVYTLTRKDNFLYASDNSGKMFVFDITNPQAPIFFASSAALPERFRKPAINNSGKVFATTFSNPSRLVVLAFDTAPIITSTAPNQGSVGVQYVYNPTVLDNESNVTLWSLINAPSGMSINPGNGQVTWTPGSGVLTSGSFYIKVQDASGLIDVELVTIYVSQAILFTSGTPVTSAPTPSGNTLTLPADTYDSGSAQFTFTELELNNQGAANIKFLDYGFKITTTGSTVFDNAIILTIHYTDAQLVAAGITNEGKMKVKFFDTQRNKWVDLRTTIDKVNNIATAELPHLTDFGFGESEGGPAAKVVTTIPGYDDNVLVLTYLRDTDTTSMRAFYIFVDLDGNLTISQEEGHEAGSPGDVIGEDSTVE